MAACNIAWADWRDITGQVTVHLGAPYTQRLPQQRVSYSDFSFTNTSGAVLVGPLRVILTETNTPLSRQWDVPDGTTPDGKPYYDIATEPAFTLPPGADSPVVPIAFGHHRPHLSYQVCTKEDGFIFCNRSASMASCGLFKTIHLSSF